MFVSIYAIRGNLSIEECKDIVANIISICGMKSNDIEAAYWKFPVLGEPNKECYTYVQPILTSFIACDQWPEIPAAYFFVVSCVHFDTSKIYNFLNEKFESVMCYMSVAELQNSRR